MFFRTEIVTIVWQIYFTGIVIIISVGWQHFKKWKKRKESVFQYTHLHVLYKLELFLLDR